MMGQMAKKADNKTKVLSPQVVNKKARYDYEILEKIEAGLSLLGTEVKSLRAGQADLSGAYARIKAAQGWLVGIKIAQYAQSGMDSHRPLRSRKLLLHKGQIKRITTKLEQRGITVVPLRIYFNERGFAKVELALAHGKKQYDKRRQIQQREHKSQIDRNMKRYRRR